jgi:hypothetical protein
MNRVSPYFGQKDATVPASNPYVSAAPVAGYPNNPILLNQYYQAYNDSIPASQAQYGVRRMLKWLVPERGIVEMYINPQSISISDSKQITTQRTKGGFIIQYWGEELTKISIQGHTGSSGVEGMNVLRDVYRGEQIAFDIIALEEATKLKQEEDEFINVAIPGLNEITNFVDRLENTPERVIEISAPTLAYYASSIEMYWMGEVYRGFFNDISVNETASRLGIFEYTINFTATQKRGYRRNYLPWHKTPLAGPSNHDIIPYTYDAKSVPSRSQTNAELISTIINGPFGA